MIEVRAAVRRDGFGLDVDFSTVGRVTALFGRSGSGKTTVADLVAGLVRPDRGRVLIDGAAVADAAAGLNEPAWRRRIGYVFQDARLFPHLTVRGNLLYGARRRRIARPPLDEIAGLLGLSALLERRPGGLSGGEARRVAIGRALLSDPGLLILDEPLSGLDGAMRADILPYLDRLARSGPPILYITHAVEEAARLADEVVLVSEGRAFNGGPPAEAFARPEAEAAAGLNAPISVLEGRATGGAPPTGVDLGGTVFQTPQLDVAAGDRVRIVIDARDIALALSDPAGVSVQNRLPMRIAAMEDRADGVLVRLERPGAALSALVTRQAAEALGLAEARPVIALIKATAAARYA